MKGIWFDDIHSYNDLNLVLSEVNIPPAEPKLNFVDIPGGDGDVDLTEALGEVKYNSREGSITFTAFPYYDFEEKKKEVSNLLNGKRCKIRLDKDPGYYWLGRCVVDDYVSDKMVRQIVVKIKVDPYKYKVNKTVASVSLAGKNLLDVSAENQTALHGEVEYISNGIRKSGSYYVSFRAYVAPNTDYSLSFNVNEITKSGAGATSGVAIYNDGKASSDTVVSPAEWFPATDGDYVFSFNSGDRTVIHVAFQSDSWSTSGEYEFTNIQLEAGEATEYEPYTTVSSKTALLSNGRKVVCPTIFCSDSVRITYGEYSTTVVLNAGTHKLLDLQLGLGTTEVELLGSGTVQFLYQEGDL